MNIKEILASKEAIEELIGIDVPINSAIKISKVQKEINDILEVYDSKRKVLFDKYGEETKEANGETKIKDENIQEFSKDILEILSEELEDFNVKPILISTLGDINIKPASITSLDWLLKDEIIE